MRKTMVGSIAAGISLFGLAIPVAGHHSMSEYDRGVVQELEGEVVEVSWRNPHILLWVSTADESGAQVEWELEGAAVSAHRRRGLPENLIAVGQQVRVAGWPSTRRAAHMQVNHVLLPDGVELLVGNLMEPRWAETAVGGERGVVDADKAAAAEGDGIFRVWTRVTSPWYFTGGSNYRLTPEAAAASAQWDDIEDNPLLDCIAPGMPGLMGNPYPMEFVQRDGYIELRFEEFDVVRTIHLESATDASDVPASHLGYSVGQWEDDTLAVTTNRIDWPYFDRVGAPQSPDVMVQERFRAVDDGGGLEYLMTVTDPATLLEPFVWDADFIWRRGEEVNLYDCTLEG